MRYLLQILPKPYLIQRLKPSWHQDFTSKLSAEIVVTLYESCTYACLCQQIRKHCAARPSTDDYNMLAFSQCLSAFINKYSGSGSGNVNYSGRLFKNLLFTDFLSAL